MKVRGKVELFGSTQEVYPRIPQQHLHHLHRYRSHPLPLCLRVPVLNNIPVCVFLLNGDISPVSFAGIRFFITQNIKSPIKSSEKCMICACLCGGLPTFVTDVGFVMDGLVQLFVFASAAADYACRSSIPSSR